MTVNQYIQIDIVHRLQHLRSHRLRSHHLWSLVGQTFPLPPRAEQVFASRCRNHFRQLQQFPQCDEERRGLSYDILSDSSPLNYCQPSAIRRRVFDMITFTRALLFVDSSGHILREFPRPNQTKIDYWMILKIDSSKEVISLKLIQMSF